jgi:hypothetical protein
MFLLKFRATGLHLLISLLVAASVLALVYLAWYPSVLSTTEGVGTILLIMLGIDVVLGPLMTLLVFKPNKPSLKFDLTVIGLVQMAFLAYGVQTVEVGRPAYVVFVKDRFESVAISDLSDATKSELSKNMNPAARTSLFKPVYIAAVRPTDPKEQYEILMSSVEGRGDIAQMPKHYAAIDGQFQAIASAAQSLDGLKALNKDRLTTLNDTIKDLGVKAENLGFLPLKGKLFDAVVFVNKQTGQIVSSALFKPW